MLNAFLHEHISYNYIHTAYVPGAEENQAVEQFNKPCSADV